MEVYILSYEVQKIIYQYSFFGRKTGEVWKHHDYVTICLEKEHYERFVKEIKDQNKSVIKNRGFRYKMQSINIATIEKTLSYEEVRTIMGEENDITY